MIENLKPYPEYKDSGLPWLGQVPAHWVERRAKYFFREVDERSESGNEELMSVSHKTGVTPRKQSVTMFLAESTVGYKICRPGDIAINTMWAFMGALGIARQEGIVSTAYGVYRPIRPGIIAREYLDKLLRTEAYKTEYIRRSTGINSSRLRLYPDQFLQIPFLCPPPDEQSAIARFLAWATNRLDRAIGAKRRIIALLQEQKQAIIHRAVTRGLDPSVPLKDSGIPWLGQIPEHWEVTALRRYWSVTDCKHLTVPFVENGIPLASVREVRKFELDLSKCKHTTPEWYQHLIHGGRKPEEGDIIYCRNVSVGSSALVTTNATFAMGQDVCLIRSELQNGQYLNYVLHSPFMKRQLELILVGSTFKRINVAQIKALMAPIPPRQEQNAIAHYLGEELRGLENASSRLESEITLLREYRTRLIADVVTGKLDVREVAAQLPEEIDSSAAFEDGFGEDDADGVTLDETEADLDEA